MKKSVYLLKLKESDNEIICDSREMLITNINLFLDKELYKEINLHKLMYYLDNSEVVFLDKTNMKYVKYKDISWEEIKYLKKKYNYNVMYHNNLSYPFVEYIKSFNWIDYTNKYFDKYYPLHKDSNEKTKDKYRNKIIESLIKKNIHSLDLSEELDLILEMNSCVSDKSYESEEDINDIDKDLNDKIVDWVDK
jgi:hypothetical protein